MFEALFENSPVATVLADADGRITAANRAARALGFAPHHGDDALLADALSRLGWRWPDGRVLGADQWPTPKDGLTTTRHEAIVNVDGREIAVARTPLASTRIEAGGAPPFVGVVVTFQDVTAIAADRDDDDRYRVLFEQSPDGILLGTPDGAILAANPAACALLGRTSEEISALGRDRVIVQNTALTQAVAERAARGRTRADLAFIRADGSLLVGDVTSVLVPHRSHVETLTIFRDAAERTRAEEATRERDRFFDLASDLLCITDMQGHLLRVNDEWTTSLGWTTDELTGRSFFDLVHPDDLAPTRDAVETLASGKRIRNFVNRYRHRDGTYRWLEWRSVAPEGRAIYGVARDITVRIRDGEALRHSEYRFKGLIEAANDAIFVQTNHRFAYVNNGTVRLFGAERPEQLLGRPVIERFDPSCREGIIARIRMLNEQGQSAPLLEQIALRLDGTAVTVEVSASPIVYEGERGAVVFARDVTERKRLEQSLVMAQRLESVGRLAGGVAHDFNNMLGVIMGHAELRLAMTAPSDPARADLEQILGAARKSADLTRQLLAFARKQTTQPRALDLNECVSSTMKMLRRLVGEDVSITWVPSTPLWNVYIDPSQIDQVLANLFVNARDAMPQGGQMRLETGNDVLDAAFCARHAGAAPGEYVRLSVSDTGVGMSSAVLRQIFEPFFTTKPAGEGTGLGLATVYGIVKQHGGAIDVYSEPGMGTTFRLWFPRHTGATGVPDAFQSPDAPPRGSETLLLVEDEPSILRLGHTMLSRLGYRVLTATHAAEALQVAAAHQDTIALLITDVVMPGGNGRELAETLQRMRPAMRCLFISGYTADVIAHHGVLAPGVRLVEKPFSLAALARGVREALDG